MTGTLQKSTHSVTRLATRPVAIWLFVMCGLVALMVLVGGATRLTDSGLSITEWKPVTGAIPPLSQADWLTEFEKYKAIPEYDLINFGMSLEEFKVIYWWEWGHRFLGRMIGLAFIIPLIGFIATGRIARSLALPLLGLFVLGGLQGALGWYMVQSGLSDRIDVSQYRLAAHLGLAIILYAAIFWLALNLISHKRSHPVKGKIAVLASVFSIGVFLQIILGAFVAGLRAGKTFNTWPLMDGRFVPEGYFQAGPRFLDLFETIAAVQFNHRLGAYIVAAISVWLFLAARRSELGKRASITAGILGFQILVGIATVAMATPIAFGLAHQAIALLLFSAALWTLHGCTRSMEITDSSSSKLAI